VESLYYRLYDENVAKYGDKVAILLQVGKFFEMYDQVDIATGKARANVQTLTELCGCAIEHRPSRDPTKTRLFWGFPEASLRKFERMLIVAGYSTFPFVQNKDGTGEVVSRSLDHIGSPGTFWDAEGGLAVRKEEQILLSVYVEPWSDSATRLGHWYISSTAFDVMTGKAVSMETDLVLIDGKPVFDAIQPFWSMFPPAEVVFVWCAPPTQPPPKETDLAALFSARRPLLHIRAVDPTVDGTATQDRLRLAFFADLFKPKTALSITEYLGIVMVPLVRRSLYHLLQFVKDHNPSYLAGLHDHTLWNPDDTLLLGNAALEQLAMIPCHADRQHESLLHWLQKALTAMGKRTLRERCLKPLADLAVLEERQDRIAALRSEGKSEREALQGILRGAFDLSRLYRRFQLGHGTTDDLLHLLATYEKAETLLQRVEGKVYDAQNSEELGPHVRTILDRWDGARIRASKAQVSDGIAVGSTHPWKRGLHASLDALEDRWAALETQMTGLKTRWEAHMEESEAITWSLKDDAPFTFTTTARRAACLAAIAKRIDKTEVRAVKRGSSTTVTLESDAIAAANIAAIALRAEWKEAVATTWAADWTAWMEEAIEARLLEAMTDWIGTLDAECALAAVSDEYGYVRPTYGESTEEAPAGVSITDLRHPIIERIHTSTPYIPHSLSMGLVAVSADGPSLVASTSHGILLYGVNAAGKSSLGKALGLAVLMAQCGMPVPATAMTLIPYTGLFTRILGNDNLWAGMSSFVVEMTEFRSILRNADRRTLVIGDELCAGTETASATAIVAAGIQTLVRRGAHFFFATHLHELLDLPELATSETVRPYHLTVHSDARRGVLVYDRRLKAGCGSPMYGLEVCRGLDMDREFLATAFEIRRRVFTEDGKARVSRYNASVVVAACAVCGARGSSSSGSSSCRSGGLETHHIVPQAAALQGRVAPGVSVHAPQNLAPLCEACHQKHHAGVLDIQGWIATTEGRILRVAPGVAPL
jgi:DNA mismatch repair protein MutS